jgi:uncharacterized protein YukE
MGFSVDPLAVEGYAAQLARARDDAQQCKSYFTANVSDLSPGIDGLINPICYEHVAVQRKLGETLDQLVTLLGSSCDEVAAIATRYRSTDQGSAARVDDSYPLVTRPNLRAR